MQNFSRHGPSAWDDWHLWVRDFLRVNPPTAGKSPVVEMGAIVEQSHNPNDVGFPISPIQPTQAAIDADPIIAWMREHVRRRPGSRVDWLAMFEAYSQASEATIMPAAHFGAAMDYICRRAGIQTRKSGDRVYCLDVRLVG